MTTYRLGVLECDGIGPEVVSAAVAVLTAAVSCEPYVHLDLVPLPVGLLRDPQPRHRAAGRSTVDALRGVRGLDPRPSRLAVVSHRPSAPS